MAQDCLDLAMKAVSHAIWRIQEDQRLAYLIGPGSETFERLTAAKAADDGLNVESFRQSIAQNLKFQPVAGIGSGQTALDEELLARIAVYDEGVHDMRNREDLAMLVNHFVRRGLDVAEAERDTATEEMF
jgi:hypothetical protein